MGGAGGHGGGGLVASNNVRRGEKLKCARSCSVEVVVSFLQLRLFNNWHGLVKKIFVRVLTY